MLFILMKRNWLNELNNRSTFVSKQCGNSMMLAKVGKQRLISGSERKATVERNDLSTAVAGFTATAWTLSTIHRVARTHVLSDSQHMTLRAEFIFSSTVVMLTLLPC